MLVVTQKETLFAATLVAPHDVGAGVLAAAIVLQAFVHIWRERKRSRLAFRAISKAQPSQAAQRLLLSKDKVPLVPVSQKLSRPEPKEPVVGSPSPHESMGLGLTPSSFRNKHKSHGTPSISKAQCQTGEIMPSFLRMPSGETQTMYNGF